MQQEQKDREAAQKKADDAKAAAEKPAAPPVTPPKKPKTPASPAKPVPEVKKKSEDGASRVVFTVMCLSLTVLQMAM